MSYPADRFTLPIVSDKCAYRTKAGIIGHMSATDDFLAWAERDRSRSQNTLTRYRAVLRDVSTHGDPIDLDREAVEAWWATRYGASPSTRANELACLRSFYKWATKFDLRPDDPTRRLDPPKVPNRLPRMIGRADFEALLGKHAEDEPELRRAYALGGYAGLRISECAALDWRDVDVEARRMFVRGKGQKERPVPINALLLDHLLPDVGGNVLTAGGSPPSPAALTRRINRHMGQHLSGRHTFHDLRKRGASIALSKGANPVAVKTMFGWSSMETVMSYAVVGDDELDRIAEMLT